MAHWDQSIYGLLAGLLAGCMVSMVSYRLPIHLRHQWRNEAHDYLGLEFYDGQPGGGGLGYGWHRKWRAVFICLGCALAGLLAVYLFGPTIHAIAFGFLFWALIAIAIIDAETLYIPDVIVLPLLWAGLLFFALAAPEDLKSHVFGAAAGYCAFRWLPVGRGDAKLCAAGGAWLGVGSLLPFLLFASIFAVAVGAFLFIFRGKSEACPFGPSLGMGIILSVTLKSSCLLDFLLGYF